MSEKNFQVGQKWTRRDGQVVTITRVSDGSFLPVQGDDGPYRRRDGRLHANDLDSGFDLVSLVTPENADEIEAPETVSAPKPEFKVGQVWRRRDGGTEKITRVDNDGTYPVMVESVNSYTLDGKFHVSMSETGADLVELVSDPSDTTATESDGWIAWAGGECPVPFGTLVDVKHRDGDVYLKRPAGVTGGAGDWSHTNDNGDIIAYRVSEQSGIAAGAVPVNTDAPAIVGGGTADQNAPQPASHDELVLFDNLVLAAAEQGQFAKIGVGSTLDLIKQVIEARRAL